MLVEHLAPAGEQPVGRGDETADALDRLGDQAGHVAAGLGGEHLAQVLHGGVHPVGLGQPGEQPAQPFTGVQPGHLERVVRAGRPAPVAGDPHGRVRPTVVAVADGEDLVRPAVVGGDQQGRLVRLGPGVGEEDPGVRDAGERGHLLGQLHLLSDQIEGGGVHQAGPQLTLHRLADLRDVVADHVGQHAAEEVQVTAPLGVGDPAAGPGHQLDRLGVVERHPGREHGPVSGQQVVGGHRHTLQRRRLARSPHAATPTVRRQLSVCSPAVVHT